MPTAARPTSTRRSAGIAAAGKRAVVAEAEARRLFENQLVHVSVKLPKTSTETAEIEFEIPIQDLFAKVLASGDVLAEALASTNGSTDAEAKPLNPTPRLRRAIASAGKVERGRFADPNEMFDALVEATRG